MALSHHPYRVSWAGAEEVLFFHQGFVLSICVELLLLGTLTRARLVIAK